VEHLRARDPLTVFVVDNDPSVRAILFRTLEREAFAVRCFATADEARIEMTRAGLMRAPVDVVLLDMALQPGSESTASAEALLESITQRVPQPEVILMSGHLSSEEFFGLIMRGATDFVAKPWSGPDLIRRIRDWAAVGRQKYLHHYALSDTRTRVKRDAFLSYGSGNTHLALGLKRVLERMGVSTWYAPADLPPGDRWPETLDAAIRECHAFLVLLTEESLASVQVMSEVRRAVARLEAESEAFLVVPVVYGVRLASVPESLRALQIVDLGCQLAFVDNIIRLADRLSLFIEERALAGHGERRRTDRRESSDRRGRRAS
jgi:FixJ family two-component response regulator